jgi:hypothetical protein
MASGRECCTLRKRQLKNGHIAEGTVTVDTGANPGEGLVSVRERRGRKVCNGRRKEGCRVARGS